MPDPAAVRRRRWLPGVLVALAMLIGLQSALAADGPYRIGLITYADNYGQFENTKRDLARYGYKENENTEYRSYEGKRDFAATVRHARALVEWQADVIVSYMSNSGVALREVTRESQTPVVAWSSDLKGAGLVNSYRSPGTNFTGANFEPYMQLVQLRFLKLAVPDLKCVGFFHNSTYAPADIELARARESAKLLELDLRIYETPALENFEASLAQLGRDGCKGFVLGPHELFSRPENFSIIGRFLREHRIAGVGQTVSVPEGGGVAAFPPSSDLSHPFLASYVHRILQGERPEDLPVRAFKNRFILNLRTAKEIGLQIPSTLIEEADDVIE